MFIPVLKFNSGRVRLHLTKLVSWNNRDIPKERKFIFKATFSLPSRRPIVKSLLARTQPHPQGSLRLVPAERTLGTGHVLPDRARKRSRWPLLWDLWSNQMDFPKHPVLAPTRTSASMPNNNGHNIWGYWKLLKLFIGNFDNKTELSVLMVGIKQP